MERQHGIDSFVQSQSTESGGAAQRPDDWEGFMGRGKGMSPAEWSHITQGGGGTQEGDLGDLSREHLGHRVRPWSPGNTRTHRANE